MRGSQGEQVVGCRSAETQVHPGRNAVLRNCDRLDLQAVRWRGLECRGYEQRQGARPSGDGVLPDQVSTPEFGIAAGYYT